MRPGESAIVVWFRKRCRILARACGLRGPEVLDIRAVLHERALERLRAACGAEQPLSEAFVGFTYVYGRGKRNAALGAAWFRMGALRGDRACQWFLGGLYAEGIGVERDQIQAYVWLSRAAQAGLAPAASEAAVLRLRLAPEQLAIAEGFLGEPTPIRPSWRYACA